MSIDWSSSSQVLTMVCSSRIDGAYIKISSAYNTIYNTNYRADDYTSEIIGCYSFSSTVLQFRNRNKSSLIYNVGLYVIASWNCHNTDAMQQWRVRLISKQGFQFPTFSGSGRKRAQLRWFHGVHGMSAF